MMTASPSLQIGAGAEMLLAAVFGCAQAALCDQVSDPEIA